LGTPFRKPDSKEIAVVIFEKTNPPSRQAKLVINREACWYTWSESFRSLFPAWSACVKSLSEPELMYFPELKKYNYTFTLPCSVIADDRLQRQLMGAVRALYNMRMPRNILLLTRLFDRHLDGHALHYLFAFLRGGLIQLSGNPMSALHTPLADVGPKASAFPLHADLYGPQVLFNVFDNVPEDSSGASVFLRKGELGRLMKRIKPMSNTIRHQILDCFGCKIGEDRFRELNDLLHGKENPWVKELERSMKACQLRVKLHSGQGYLIHDRAWLHGREAPKGGVPPNRMHRLVFDVSRTLGGK
jgi:hypothetical protein